MSSTISVYGAEYPVDERNYALSSLERAIKRYTDDPGMEVVKISEPRPLPRNLNGREVVGYAAVVDYNRKGK